MVCFIYCDCVSGVDEGRHIYSCLLVLAFRTEGTFFSKAGVAVQSFGGVRSPTRVCRHTSIRMCATVHTTQLYCV
jgi:hypothetical protein